MSHVNRSEREQMDFLGLAGIAPFGLVTDGSPGHTAAAHGDRLQPAADRLVWDKQPCLQSINFVLVVCGFCLTRRYRLC